MKIRYLILSAVLVQLLSLQSFAQVTHWRLNNDATDASGNSINGTLMNSASFTTDSKEGTYALTTNGTNQYIDFGNPSGLPSGTSSRTISLWAKTNTVSGTHVGFAYGTATNSQSMYLGQSGTSLVAGAFTNGLTVTNFWATGVWHHICLTYNGTTAKLYADGVEVSSSTKNWPLVLLRAYIGRNVNNNDYWNGTLDDVRIYNTALTATEVQALAVSQPPPTAPSNMTTTANGSSKIDLNWTDNSNNETGFQIERSLTSGSGYSLVSTTAADITTFANTGLTAGTTYYYRIRAINGSGNSSYTTEASATTTVVMPPSAPTGLTTVAVSTTTITLSWTDNSNNETGFEIERSLISGSGYSLISTAAVNAVTFTSTGLVEGTTYYFRIRAVNADGNSSYTSEAAAATSSSPLAAPSALTAVAGSSTTINLTWTDNSNNETGFQIERSLVAGSGYTLIHTTAANANSFSNTGLSASTTYYYSIRAVNASGNSSNTSIVNATTTATGGSPTGAWRLDNNITDASGNGINGTLMNSPGFTTDNKEGTHALTTNGTNQYVDLGNPQGLPSGTASRSISMWAKTNTVSGTHVGFAYGTGVNSQSMYLGQNGTSLVAGAFTNGLTVTNFWAPGVWHHICLTYNGTTAKLYADGVEVSSAAKSWPLVLLRAYIGRNVNNSDYWNGTIDDVRIYSTALTAAEVQMLAISPPVAPSNVVAAASSFSNVNLSWTDNSTNETGFQIERSLTSGTGYSLITITSADAVSFADTDLSENTTYYYRIRAINAGGNSVYASVTVSTPVDEGTVPDAIELNALKDIRQLMSDNYWPALNTWPADANSLFFATLPGITVSGGDVAWIHLEWKGLSGTLPESLGDLQALQILNLARNNALVGAVPTQITQLNNLVYVYLQECGLTSLPDMSQMVMGLYMAVDVSDNYIPISDIEKNGYTFSSYEFYPQKSLVQFIDVNAGSVIIDGGLGSEPQWQTWNGSDWIDINGQNLLQLKLTNVDLAYVGKKYRCRMFLSWDFYAEFYSHEYTIQSVTITPIPPAPSELISVISSSTRVDLSWSDNSINETGFEIERSLTSGSGYSLIATTAINVNTFTDNGVSDGIRYYYRIRAINAAGNSAYTSEINVTTTLSAPSNIVVTSIGHYGSIDLLWTDNSSNETGFEVERSLESGANYSLVSTTDRNYFYDFNLTIGIIYYYRVRAVNGICSSEYIYISVVPEGLAYDSEELIALQDLRRIMNSSYWPALSSWPENANIEFLSTLPGVVTADGDITEIHLQSTQLTGTIPISIAKLKSLIILDLSSNPNLGGAIPIQISQLDNLDVLKLNHCGFTSLPEIAGTDMAWQLFLDIRYNFITLGDIENNMSGIEVSLISPFYYNPQNYFGIKPIDVVAGTVIIQNNHGNYSANDYKEHMWQFWNGSDWVNMPDYAYDLRLTNVDQSYVGNKYRCEVYSLDANMRAYSYEYVIQSVTITPIPPAPTALECYIINSFFVDLKWQDNSINETAFEIERSVASNTGFSLIHTTTVNTAAYIDESALSNNTYYYRVRAINANGNSPYSNVYSIHVPLNTTGIKPMYNGLITAMRWRTDKAYQVEGEDFSGMYVYTYDDKYQISEARWGTVNNVLNTFEGSTQKYWLTGMQYDANGNIRALQRYSENGIRTNNFSYRYEYDEPLPKYNNKLKTVDGYASFAYNSIGQMVDADKEGIENDQYVEYDVSGKVTKVFSKHTRQPADLVLENIYDDRGFRLAKVVYPTVANEEVRTTWYIRDASGNVLSTYEQIGEAVIGNTHDVVQTEIPVYGSGKLGTYYSQQDGSMSYEITDHLGNVRALLRDNVTVFKATMEDNGIEGLSNPRNEEEQFFINLSATEVTDVHMNHSPPIPGIVDIPNKAAYLHWVDGVTGMDAVDKSVGPAIMLHVSAGDEIKLETWAKYEIKTSYNRDIDLLLLSQFLGGTFANVGGFEGMTQAATGQIIDDALGAANYGNDTEQNRPFAYLNYIVFDNNMNDVDAKSLRISTDAGYETEALNLTDSDPARIAFENAIKINTNGYIYVWVSNESENTNVWFDDLTVEHTMGIVTQATDYGVWGDVLREQKSDESVYRFGYQGQFAEKDKETGWNHFELREFDPIIGRWTSIDPYAQYWSPYVGMGNEPINTIDADGGSGTSTHTDKYGNVVAVYNDGDLSVYKHDDLTCWDGKSILSREDADTDITRMGYTSYWDEFIVPGTNRVEGSIHFNDDWQELIDWGNNLARNQDLSITMEQSKSNGILDIKTNGAWADAGPMTGRLLNGKYATARSAGNFLAGLNGVTGTFQGHRISGDTYMRLAGAYQLKKLTIVNISKIVFGGVSFGKAPYYGEQPYSGRRVSEGINFGLKK